MAAPTALSDTAPNTTQLGVKHGFIRRIYFQAAIGATGAITVTAAASDGISATRTSTGLYALTNLPTGGAKRVLAAGGTFILPSTTVTAADASVVNWGPIDLSAGTASLLTRAGDDGDVADPTSGSTLLGWLEISCGT
jgi:hypothetical protein